MSPVIHVLLWIGFGLAVGVLAKCLMPGRDPGGLIFTMVLGILGALVGNALYFLITGDKHYLSDSFSVAGVALAVGGAIVLLAAHRLFFGTPRRRR